MSCYIPSHHVDMEKDNEKIYSRQFNIYKMLTQCYFSFDNYILIYYDNLSEKNNFQKKG